VTCFLFPVQALREAAAKAVLEAARKAGASGTLLDKKALAAVADKVREQCDSGRRCGALLVCVCDVAAGLCVYLCVEEGRGGTGRIRCGDHTHSAAPSVPLWGSGPAPLPPNNISSPCVNRTSSRLSIKRGC
jgi:hypothetical protein